MHAYAKQLKQDQCPGTPLTEGKNIVALRPLVMFCLIDYDLKARLLQRELAMSKKTLPMW